MNTDTIEESGPSGFARRKFLATAGALTGAVVLAACGSSDSNSDKTTTTKKSGASDESTTTEGGEGPERNAENDLKIGAFAASLEVLAVNTYKAGLDAATAGKLGDVPPAVGEYAMTAMKQHQAQLDRWNEILDDADKDKVTDPPKELSDQVNDMFSKVTDIPGLAKLALMLEEIASATYLKVIPVLATEVPISVASSIQIIDMQHQAILNYALGNYPVPDTFAKTDKAVSPSGSKTTQSSDSSGGGDGVSTKTIEIKNFAFMPKTLKAKVGDTITCKNEDDVAHTCTSDDGAPSKFDTGDIKGGASKDIKLDKAGTYKYHCSIHEYMEGTIEVS